MGPYIDPSMYMEGLQLGEIKRPNGVSFGYPKFSKFVNQFIASIEHEVSVRSYGCGFRPESLEPVFGVVNYSDALLAALQDFRLEPDLSQDFESTPKLLGRAEEILEDSLVKGISEYQEPVHIMGLCGLSLAPKGFSLRQAKYHTRQKLLESFEDHNYLPTSGFELVVPVFTIEFQGITSSIVEGQRIGQPMGNRTMERLTRREPPFENLRYADPFMGGIATRFHIRKKAAPIRELSQMKYQTREEKMGALRKKGIDFDVDFGEDVEVIGKGANLRKGALLYQFAKGVLMYMHERKMLDIPDRYVGEEGFEEFAKDQSALDDLIVKVLMVGFIKDDLGVSNNRSFIGDNKTWFPVLRYPSVPTYNVIQKFYPITIP